MKNPVFLSQNHKTFSSPRPHPKSQPMKAFVLTALPCVDQSNCGMAMIDATTKKASHSRHFLILISASTPPTPIVAMKLCACTSGNRPATQPAAIMRRSGKELRAKRKGRRAKGKEFLFDVSESSESDALPLALG